MLSKRVAKELKVSRGQKQFSADRVIELLKDGLHRRRICNVSIAAEP
ncbi:MAG: hypothetical protein ACXU9F_06920 [Syntrophales bacterium]